MLNDDEWLVALHFILNQLCMFLISDVKNLILFIHAFEIIKIYLIKSINIYFSTIFHIFFLSFNPSGICLLYAIGLFSSV